MQILIIILVFLSMLGLGIFLTVYTFYLFFMKNVPDTDEVEISERMGMGAF